MRAFYNEIDRYCCDWLQNLMDAGLITPGKIDDRPIQELSPDDVRGFERVHFFAGIAGWDYALTLSGYDGPVWTGSCPCQPFSAAGKGQASSDERHLWPEWLRLIRACKPRVIFGEQVASAAVIGPIQEMQGMRREKADQRFQDAQQGRFPWDVSGLREQDCARAEALAPQEQESLSGAAAAHSSRFCVDERCEAASAGQRHPIRPGLEGHSAANRRGALRSDRHGIRPSGAESVECAVTRPNRSEQGLHKGEHASGSLCSEHNGECMGDRTYLADSGFDQGETVRQQVERIIAETSRPPQGELGWPWLDLIRLDLADAGYAIGACVVPACAVSAPHIRQRLWFMANTESCDREISIHQRRQDETISEFGGASGIGELANSNGGNASAERLQRSGKQRQQQKDGGTGIMADSNQSRCRKRRPREASDGRDTPWLEPSGFCADHWQDLTWLPCTDGKQRPTKPGLFPLAHGISGRVAKLRAVGNAIVPQVAAEFIKASMTP